jgi:putative ABC transport system permease protein
MNPRVCGIRLDMLAHLYRRRLRAHPVAELLAGAGVAIGVALVFSVLLANASLTSSAGQLIRGLAGSARWELTARSSAGFTERVVTRVGELEGVQVAAPVLRENVTLATARGQQAVQLIGLTPSLEALGGVATQELSAASLLLKGGVGLPSGVATTLAARPGTALSVAAAGQSRQARVRVVLADSIPAVAASPVAVAVLPVAQALAVREGRVTEILIRPRQGAQARVERTLTRIAAADHLDLRPAEDELRLLTTATTPNRQSTSLFTAIAVMIGFLLALNAMLLTVPERRRFIAELRMQGYDARQIVLLLAVQALVLGGVASLAGLALGYVLSHALFQQVPDFLTAAFPIGAEEVVRASTVAIALGCGVLATALASLTPLLDLRPSRSADAAFRELAVRSEVVRPRTIRALLLVGLALIAASTAVAVAAPNLTIASGVGLALSLVCFIPAAFAAFTWLLPRATDRVRSSALIVALAELRAVTTRSVALAAIVALAVYGGVAIGGAREDLLRGIDRATAQYFSTAPVWVTSGRDVFNTNSYDSRAPARALARAGDVASVRVYRGGLLDVGERRVWVRARPLADPLVLESTQLLDGDYATATRLIRGGGYAAASSLVAGPRPLRPGGWAAVSSDFASEHHLRVGGAFVLPTPTGEARLGVAAITTNSGWPAGAITLSAPTYARLWGSSEASALEVTLKPGVTPAAGRRAVLAALGPHTGLDVRTASERSAESAASARQGLRTLQEISTLLLVAAALSVASALSAAIWQRRLRLASLKLQGYDPAQLWRAVLLESAFTLSVGALLGGLLGVAGHALAGRFLQLTTGFPAPFAVGAAQVALTVGLFLSIALVVIALPGLAAARISPRAVLQE